MTATNPLQELKEGGGFAWTSATEDARVFYCAVIAGKPAGHKRVALLKEGLDEFFNGPRLLHHRIAFAAGNILTSIDKFGDWKPIVQSFKR